MQVCSSDNINRSAETDVSDDDASAAMRQGQFVCAVPEVVSVVKATSSPPHLYLYRMSSMKSTALQMTRKVSLVPKRISLQTQATRQALKVDQKLPVLCAR